MPARYILRRTLHAILVLFGVSVLSFVLLDLAPGDYFEEARLDPQISREAIAGLRAQYGLASPLPVRYGRWLASCGRGDFGISLAYNMPAARLLGPRLRNTLLLAIPSVLLAWGLAIPLAVWAAYRKGSWPDGLLALSTSALLSVPELLLACAVVLVAARTGVLPAGGSASPGLEGADWAARAVDLARHMCLPVAVLTAGTLPLLLRHAREATADVLALPFITAARAHGIARRRIVWRYVLPVAANPLVTLAGVSLGTLVSTSLLVEVVMGWPGLGPLLLDAMAARDVHVILDCVVLSAGFLAAGSLVSDMLLYAVDPRIRVSP